ncbi:MAG: aldo/keto reductase [Oscillospiraceae bacterium]|nr:aldo/keto reductase [Oscillospiraceae bacterium]
MLYREISKTETAVSQLGYGCMRFPRGVSGQFDRAKTEKLVLQAYNSGIGYFDTAYLYGGSEELLGEILEKHGLREKVRIATKLPHGQCRSYEDFSRLFGTSLARLKTGYADMYLIHNVSSLAQWERLAALGIARWIEGEKQSGRIRKIGFSFHGARPEFMKLLEAYAWDFCQIQYNYVNEHDQAGVAGLRRAHELGLAVIIMEPLLGGKLAAKLPKPAQRVLDGANAKLGADRTPAAWGLRWLWNQPEVTVVLSGMNSEEQLTGNLATADESPAGCLSDAELAVFEPLKAAFRESYKVPCTGCAYCMPCPRGVNIPGVFAAYNARFAHGLIPGMQQYVTGLGLTDRSAKASPRNCVKCRECERKCPQNIEVSARLGEAARVMEPWWFRGALGIVRRFFGG